MMKLFGVLLLLATLSVGAYGLKCYYCLPTTDPENCKAVMNCPPGYESCSTTQANGFTVKTCMVSSLCQSPVKCCKEDLCNSAITTGSSVLLLLVSSAVTSVFL